MTKSKQLHQASKSATKKFSNKPVGSSTQPCPAEDKQLLTVQWQPLTSYCGDRIAVKATAKGMPANTKANAQVKMDGKTVATLEGTGMNSFNLPWEVKDVVFTGEAMPVKFSVQAMFVAGGQSKQTEKDLDILRVPDKAPEPISFTRRSGRFGWTAAFRAGINKNQLTIQQTIQIKKAWLGKWVEFDNTLDGRSGWSWVKKVGTDWKFWDTSVTPNAWSPLPRGISDYTVNNVVFVQKGSEFVSRDNDSFKWPEAFSEPSNYAQKKNDWLSNIHQVWDNKFELLRKNCQSSDKNCCKWRIRVEVKWDDNAGDKLVYAIAAQDWERSNAKDWYLSEHRLGVAGHECGHLLGAYDEYTGGAIDTATNIIDNDSIMGQNLTKGHPRHLDGLRDQVKSKINGWIGRSWDFEVKNI